MGVKEITERLEGYRKKLEDLSVQLRISEKKDRLAYLQQKAQEPTFWDDTKSAKKLSQETDDLKLLLDLFAEHQDHIDDVEALLELYKEDTSQEDFLREAEDLLQTLHTGFEQIEFRKMLSNDIDRSNALLNINAGAGGTESCDWVSMLYRMYVRWAERKGYQVETLDFTEGDGAGFKSVTLSIQGTYAYGYLKAENGVHRLVRISPFDANKRRHTSFASVHATADIEDDIEVEVNMEDVRVDTFRAGGKGGQHQNKTDSAVRFTHHPSGIVVSCRSERSQHQNRDRAMRMLKSRLYELELEKRLAEKEATEKQKKRVEWGSQIRSYVMQPYQLVKDHRTNHEVATVDKVMDGDLDEFMKAYLLEYSE
ncbi:MAG: peptide chain release factor 2 [Deltaproteobacteria bacterium CG11_big_fil_rev_8_21_14_0_20_42_23]|nr:MAG: peptide chain release factor 2 [Deltaproteobacteria bacterium CG11_big_fil_rev_8_21_14_0_20_42_23]PJC63839.1 MAG: peptide chain release factor 2 [Deltaproteobacteria bacterium CG_4_9_14_0_2_um_filter_42_21]